MRAGTGAGRAAEHLQVSEPVERFARLAEIAGNPDDLLEIDVSRDRTETGLPLIAGRVRGQIALVCQRCLGTVHQPVDVALSLGIVDEESEATLPTGYEPWETDRDGLAQLRLRTVIEDEILLALPLVARHDDEADCSELADKLAETDEHQAADVDDDNPFAVLKALKRPD